MVGEEMGIHKDGSVIRREKGRFLKEETIHVGDFAQSIWIL
jgi:hypothetical protein